MKVENIYIERTIITLKEEEVLRNFKESWHDVMEDADIEDMESMAKGFQEDCSSIARRDYKKLFNNGMTMMLVGEGAFNIIENYFKNKKKNVSVGNTEMLGMSKELYIVIDCGVEMITIEEQYIQY